MAHPPILIAGAAGRMGRALIAEVLKTPGASLAGGFERAESPLIGADLGTLVGTEPLGVALAAGPEGALPRAGVLIDFTAPSASLAHARAAAAAGVALVIGTTGFSADEEAEIAALAKRAVIVKSGNMSLGVTLLSALVEQAARTLADDYDIEIVEAHHRAKVDAPSGTALLLARAAAEGRGVDLAEKQVLSRVGATGPRQAGDIGFAVVRGGGVIGEHHAIFAGDQEVLTLSHQALDRAVFARGAVAAALWTAGRRHGLYTMRDVLGLS